MLHSKFHHLKADTCVALFMAAWWVVNLIQSATTGLANDEAYYWYYSQNIDWGYFDHPPMVALLVWLSSWLPGTLGVRLATTLLQPLYLLLFWHTIKPVDATRRDAVVYSLVCFAVPLLQLYGFLALPDAPLMFFSVLVLYCFKRYSERPSLLWATLFGVAVALLGYSKYHGLLVVLLVVASNPKLFRDWRLYYAAAVALLLMVPHLMWQYNHDWVSLQYHLVERNRSYRVNYTLEFLGTLLVVFNPLWLYFTVPAFKGKFWHGTVNRALTFLFVGFVSFFLLSTVRGPAQAQWVLPAVLPVIAFTFQSARQSIRHSRFVRRAGCVMVALFLCVRIVVAANPFNIKGELWDKPVYSEISDLADGRPVEILGDYTSPAKYMFYTGGQAYSAAYFFDRTSQWVYDTTDRTWLGRNVIICNFANPEPMRLELSNGRTLYYYEASDFVAMRELTVRPVKAIDYSISFDTGGFTPIDMTVEITNPYHYDIVPDTNRPLRLGWYFHYAQRTAPSAKFKITDTLKAHSTQRVDCHFVLPKSLPQGTYPSGFTLSNIPYISTPNSPRFDITLEKDTITGKCHIYKE